jgi:putative DNA primase/helicase
MGLAMHFLDFCRLHGVIIDREPPIGVWKRYPTEDKRHHRNGAVKFMGDHAFVQNHATETEISVWHSDGDSAIDPNKARRAVEAAARDIREKQQEAARKAASILNQCQIGYHPYLERKGFAEDQANVFLRDGLKIMAIPMRVGHHLVGCQLIDESGEKKFLTGQRTSNATFTFDNKGPHILVEGYATALSVRAALKALKRRYTLHVCFSAGNLAKVAATLPKGFVVCDNDASRTGENTATKTGFPYWMSDTVGEDFNDFHQRVGLFKASQSLGKVIK